MNPLYCSPLIVVNNVALNLSGTCFDGYTIASANSVGFNRKVTPFKDGPNIVVVCSAIPPWHA